MAYYDYDEDRDLLDFPYECPKCGSELELDVSPYDYETHLVCSNSDCDYELDVTADFEKLEELKEHQDDDDDDSDEN